MQPDLVLFRGVEQRLRFVVEDEAGNPVSSAAVTVTITAPDGTIIVNAANMAWTPASNDYEYVLLATFNPAASNGPGYQTLIQGSVAGVNKVRKLRPTVVADDTVNG